ncbi:MAG: hypothetical protein IPO09_14970 [Anaeromyxobacter sp.]|nr:hypothetical protein [Anaeromyxobacter sp.]MBL0277105.1 hypothetical protein [Anaeromyxobacter sp.]
MSKKMRALLLVAVAVAGLSACGGGGSDPTPTPPPDGTGTVGVAGGTVTLSTGAAVTIPAGALAGDRTITVAADGTTAPNGNPRYRFGPAGTTFTSPATVTLPRPAGLAVGTAASVYWTKLGSENTYDALPATVTASGVTAQVSHFSLGFVGLPPASGFQPPAGTVAVDFRVDDTANRLWKGGELAWKGSMRHDPVTRAITLDPSWAGPFPLLYDDGPWDGAAGGHEPSGAVAGDSVLGATVFATPGLVAQVYQYGLVDGATGSWLWKGAGGGNGTFTVQPGAASAVLAPGMAFSRLGEVDLRFELDSKTVLAANPPYSISTVAVKGSVTAWKLLDLVDDGTNGDRVAGDGVFTTMLSAMPAATAPPYLGLAQPGQVVEFLLVLGGRDYRDLAGLAALQGVSVSSMAPGSQFWAPLQLAALPTGSQNATASVPLTQALPSVSGIVTGTTLARVRLTLTGAATRVVESSSSGAYSFGGLQSGSYVVTPAKPGYSFLPARRTVVVGASDVSGVDFVASGTGATLHSVSGFVTGSATSGVSMSLDGAFGSGVTTDAGGAFVLSGVADGTYVLTPTRTGHLFTPIAYVVVVQGADVSNRNFLSTTLPLGCGPVCTGRTCGPDSCGGTCGTCQGANLCQPEGTCMLACEVTPCAGAATCQPDGTCMTACELTPCAGAATCQPDGSCKKACELTPCAGAATCQPDGSCKTACEVTPCAGPATCQPDGTCKTACEVTPCADPATCQPDGTCKTACEVTPCAGPATCQPDGTCKTACEVTPCTAPATCQPDGTCAGPPPKFWRGSYTMTVCSAPDAAGSLGSGFYCNSAINFGGAFHGDGTLGFRTDSDEPLNFRRDYLGGGSNRTVHYCRNDSFAVPAEPGFFNEWNIFGVGAVVRGARWTVSAQTADQMSGTFTVDFTYPTNSGQVDVPGSAVGTWSATASGVPFPKCIGANGGHFCTDVNFGYDHQTGTSPTCDRPYIPFTGAARPGEWSGLP